MKRTINFITTMLLILLPAGIALAQSPIVGVSDAFTFDTRPEPVPLSAMAMFIAGLLPLGYSLLRYYRQGKNGNL